MRASLGLGSGIDDIEVLAGALDSLIGPRRKRARRERATARFAAPVAGVLHLR